jgi:pimeloyl-ACP methyl ester carboxylesterase
MVMIDIGGHEVHADLAGGDAPPVVAVSALGTDSSQWHPVIARLTTHPQVITYDRPGTGRSQPRPAPNPPQPYRRFADELATMLPRLGVSAAVVAVGHSFGSLIIQSFAARHPDRVAGMVHVDASLPAMVLWPDYGPLVDGPGARATTVDADLGAAELTRDRLPEVPTVVIARTPGRWRSPRADATVDQSWQDNQVQLAHRCQAPLLIATDAGHDIPAEATDLVAFGIDQVVRAVRSGTARALIDPAAARAVGATLALGPA